MKQKGRTMLRLVITAALATLAACALAFPAGAAAGEGRFYPVELFVDSGDAHLAAWQAELAFPAPQVVIVGVEGGEPPFAEAPHHDPRGLEAGRVVIAAFTLEARPPSGRVRVARIHLLDRGGDAPITARLIVAADPDGNEIEARIDAAPAKEGSK